MTIESDYLELKARVDRLDPVEEFKRLSDAARYHQWGDSPVVGWTSIQKEVNARLLQQNNLISKRTMMGLMPFIREKTMDTCHLCDARIATRNIFLKFNKTGGGRKDVTTDTFVCGTVKTVTVTRKGSDTKVSVGADCIQFSK